MFLAAHASAVEAALRKGSAALGYLKTRGVATTPRAERLRCERPVPVHRRVLQPEPPPLRLGIPVPDHVPAKLDRTTGSARYGSMRTTGWKTGNVGHLIACPREHSEHKPMRAGSFAYNTMPALTAPPVPSPDMPTPHSPRSPAAPGTAGCSPRRGVPAPGRRSAGPCR